MLKGPNLSINFTSSSVIIFALKRRFCNIVYMWLDISPTYIGIPSKMVGRKYIHDAILYLIENKGDNTNVIRHLTNIYKKSGNTITNGIQNAIIHAWNKTAVDDLLEYYRARINPETGIPTPMEFIYYYVEKIEREL